MNIYICIYIYIIESNPDPNLSPNSAGALRWRSPHSRWTRRCCRACPLGNMYIYIHK